MCVVRVDLRKQAYVTFVTPSWLDSYLAAGNIGVVRSSNRKEAAMELPDLEIEVYPNLSLWLDIKGRTKVLIDWVWDDIYNELVQINGGDDDVLENFPKPFLAKLMKKRIEKQAGDFLAELEVFFDDSPIPGSVLEELKISDGAEINADVALNLLIQGAASHSMAAMLFRYIRDLEELIDG